MNQKKILIFLATALFSCTIFTGVAHADRWYWNYKILKVGISSGTAGGTLTITDGTTVVQKILDPNKEFRLLTVALTAYSNDSKVHVHYVYDRNCFDAVGISDETP